MVQRFGDSVPLHHFVHILHSLAGIRGVEPPYINSNTIHAKPSQQNKYFYNAFFMFNASSFSLSIMIIVGNFLLNE